MGTIPDWAIKMIVKAIKYRFQKINENLEIGRVRKYKDLKNHKEAKMTKKIIILLGLVSFLSLGIDAY